MLSLGRDFVSFPVAVHQRQVQVPVVKKFTQEHRTVVGKRSVCVKTPLIQTLFHQYYFQALKRLNILCDKEHWLVLDADKNVGLCICSEVSYKDWLDAYLLKNHLAYQPLSEEDAGLIRLTFRNDWSTLLCDMFRGTPPQDVVLPRGDHQFSELPARLRLMPKVHKKPMDVRPIVDASYCFITDCDVLLARCLKKLRWFRKRPRQYEVWSSLHMVSEVVNRFQSICRFPQMGERSFAVDVDAMYTSIDQAKLIDAMMEMWRLCVQNDRLNLFSSGTFIVSGNQFKLWIHLLLKSLVIRMDERLMLQCVGIPMGIASAPMLAVYYMSIVEAKLNTIPRLYVRYVDDIFCWCSEEILQKFITDLHNCSGLHVKVDLNGDAPFLDSIPHLDLESRSVTFKPYRKPMDRSMPPHVMSSIPRSWARGMLMGEIHRVAVVTQWYANVGYRTAVPLWLSNTIHRWRMQGHPLDWIYSVIAQTISSQRYLHKMDMLHELLGYPVAEILQRVSRRVVSFQLPKVIFMSAYLPGDQHLIHTVFQKWRGTSFGPISITPHVPLWSEDRLAKILQDQLAIDLDLQAAAEVDGLNLTDIQ